MAEEVYGALETDDTLSVFVPDDRNASMQYTGLRCICGGKKFRLSGWLTISSFGEGFFWRSLARVWREVRHSMSGGEGGESHFRLPILTHCGLCDSAAAVLDSPTLVARLADQDRQEPQESLRCRVCGRGHFELVVGVEGSEPNRSMRSVEVIARCHRCHRQERIAWSMGEHSDQEIKLDLLYGRR